MGRRPFPFIGLYAAHAASEIAGSAARCSSSSSRTPPTPTPTLAPSPRHSALTAPQICPGPAGRFSLRPSLSRPNKPNPSRLPARDADAAERVSRLGKEDLLARAPFLGGGEGEEAEPSPSSPSIPSSEDQALSVSKPRKPRVCTRKVRGARIRTPTPSPTRSPDNCGTSTGSIVDPLYRVVLMIPTTLAPPTAAEDLLALARNRGIF
ncbi:uncharacterized protein C2845_PM03G33450 [Panicum miliaceum]|uniref:Uncharacterized protein n=1 Tax=Panicum miliaceum TaxID=4540 RepID=A0A3L6TGB9_PANMI|nr:uncharacterized protein C2845_PM03G33450 [Panicum miliaceum]